MTSNGTMANSSKKRRASEIDSDYSGKQKSKKSNRIAADDLPFILECPYKPSENAEDDVFVQKEKVVPGLEFDFGVRPGHRWEEMRSYRNIRLGGYTFSIGNVIYINKQNPPPESPRSDATDDEILKYDRTNFWVGQIADTRAESDKSVFIRVYWLYWPEELPMGRQSYHGTRELILSNAMDIVDAQTISYGADLTYWDEKDTNQGYRDRFWRQTFDISQLGKDKKGGLSELRKHCRCQQPHNPDKTMFQCKQQTCATWNHEECLVKDLLRRVWPVYQGEGTLESLEKSSVEEEEHDTENTLRNKSLSPVRCSGQVVQDRMSPALSTVAEQSTVRTTSKVANEVEPSPKKSRVTKKAARSGTPATRPWQGKLDAQIINTDDEDDESPVMAKVTELRGEELNSELRSWNIRINCLICSQGM